MVRIIPLISTALQSVAYDEDAETLDVTFVNGRSYTHEGVPPAVVAQLERSSSPGSFYHIRIKGVY